MCSHVAAQQAPPTLLQNPPVDIAKLKCELDTYHSDVSTEVDLDEGTPANLCTSRSFGSSSRSNTSGDIEGLDSIDGQALDAAIEQTIEWQPCRPAIQNPAMITAASTEQSKNICEHNPHAVAHHNKGKLRLGFRLPKRRPTVGSEDHMPLLDIDDLAARSLARAVAQAANAKAPKAKQAAIEGTRSEADAVAENADGSLNSFGRKCYSNAAYAFDEFMWVL